MIVAMKKVTLFCMKSEQDITLDRLRNLGVVHINSIKPEIGEDLDVARTELNSVKEAYDAIPEFFGSESSIDSIDVILEKTWALIKKKNELINLLEKLKFEKKKLLPYGDFDPVLFNELNKKGVYVRLYFTSSRDPVYAPKGTFLYLLSKDKSGTYFAIVGNAYFKVDYEEFPVPEYSISLLDKKILETENSRKELNGKLRCLSKDKAKIGKKVHELEEKIKFLQVKNGMGIGGEKIVYLQGYVPEEQVESINRKSSEYGWGIDVEDVGNDDEVPTLIRNPKWVEPIKAVFNMINILPGYKEIDISSVFLIFFSIFFAILVGDAGYGALFLGITYYLKNKLPEEQSGPLKLLSILSICTIFWGVITGNYFGVTTLPGPFSWLKINWLNNENNIMKLCFFIGAVHLTIAHIWNCSRIINSTKAIAQVGWVGMTWVMYFTAKAMILDIPFPSWVFYLLGFSMVSILLFMVPAKQLKKDWPDLVMFPLNIISNFVDVVSYVRLFAVGSASLAVAMSFNEMAIGSGIDSVWAGLGAALIIFLGHSLNISLVALGILVHGVRLNTLEFSGHIGVQWKGTSYNPFRRIALKT